VSTERPKWLLPVCLAGLVIGVVAGGLGPALLSTNDRPLPTDHPVVTTGDGPAATAPPRDPNAPTTMPRRRPPQWVDVTATSGIDFTHFNGQTGRYEYVEVMGGGVVSFDYDGDGDLDLYFVNGNRVDGQPDPAITNRLYRNEGQLSFRDVTDEAGVGDAGYGQGAAAADYDQDGDLDLYVTNYGPNTLYRNNGDGTFTDVTTEAGVGDEGWGQSVCFVDLDGDGWLDLYVQNYLQYGSTRGVQSFIYVGQQRVPDYPSPLGFPGAGDRVYRNRGDGTFQDVTSAAGLDGYQGKGMGLACVDYDGDGQVDVFVANDTMENFLFRNIGQGRFEEVAHLAGVAYNTAGVPEASMGVDVADYDHDGDWDYIVPCLSRQFFTLYRNDGPQFTDVSSLTGLAQATAKATGFDAHFLDYDNDGNLDLFFTCGGVRMNEDAPPQATYNQRYGMPDLLLANDGNGHFQNVADSAGPYFQRALIGRGSVVADLDNDGDQDLVVSNLGDRAVLLRNDTPGGHWLTLQLEDRQGRQDPNGVSVWVTAGGQRRHATTHPGTTFLSQSDRRLHFGLGDATTVQRIEIAWPSGTQQVLENVAADQLLRVAE
jgi:enediyne biosynthesis protein E4